MTPQSLRAKLRRMHVAAEAAITPGMDYADWLEHHGGPTMRVLIDYWYKAIEDNAVDPELRRIRAEFNPREEVLIARARVAAYPDDVRARVSLAIELERAARPDRDIPPISYWSDAAVQAVVDGTSIYGIKL